jgi:hypothetical protein
MKRNEAYPSKWLKAEDLKGQDTTVRITGMSSTRFDDGGVQRVILLANGVKPLGLCRMNWDTIADMHGDDDDEWIGCEVTLFPTKVQGKDGRRVPAIRIRDQKPGTNGNGSSPRPVQSAKEEFNEFETPANGNGNGHATEDPMFAKYIAAVEGPKGLRTLHVQRWLDRWTDRETGEIPEAVKEPCNKFQLDNHLVKEGIRLGYIKKESLPEGKWSPQHYGLATAALIFGPHKAWLKAEIEGYLAKCDVMTEAALRKSNPELFDPADGAGDGEVMGDDDPWGGAK